MQMAIDGDTPFLPEEIITNILKRLPVKSLIQFQYVCKQWKKLIKTPYFIADHLHFSTHQNPFLLFQRNSKAYPLELCLLDSGMQVREVQNTPLIGGHSLCGRIIDSSNGLLLLKLKVYDTFTSSLILWNPAIREVRQVPRTINDVEHHFTGFGFSPIANDYKIVRTYTKPDDVVNRVEMYSLCTGSWKEIDLGNLEGVKLFCDPETITTNGAMFWFGSKLGAAGVGENDIDDFIVSFDIAMEVFTLIPPPPSVSHFSARFTVYENKLAIVSVTIIGEFESSFINLWVMEEGTGASGERWSWIKKYSSNPYTCLLTPATIWRNEIVCIVDLMTGPDSVIEYVEKGPKTVLSFFNLDANEVKMFAIHSHRCGNGHCNFNYVESLVPVGNIHIEEL